MSQTANSVLPLLVSAARDSMDPQYIYKSTIKSTGNSNISLSKEELPHFKSIIKSYYTLTKQCIDYWGRLKLEPPLEGQMAFTKAYEGLVKAGVTFGEYSYFRPQYRQNLTQNYTNHLNRSKKTTPINKSGLKMEKSHMEKGLLDRSQTDKMPSEKTLLDKIPLQKSQIKDSTSLNASRSHAKLQKPNSSQTNLSNMNSSQKPNDLTSVDLKQIENRQLQTPIKTANQPMDNSDIKRSKDTKLAENSQLNRIIIKLQSCNPSNSPNQKRLITLLRNYSSQKMGVSQFDSEFGIAMEDYITSDKQCNEAFIEQCMEAVQKIRSIHKKESNIVSNISKPIKTQIGNNNENQSQTNQVKTKSMSNKSQVDNRIQNINVSRETTVVSQPPIDKRTVSASHTPNIPNTPAPPPNPTPVTPSAVVVNNSSVAVKYQQFIPVLQGDNRVQFFSDSATEISVDDRQSVRQSEITFQKRSSEHSKQSLHKIQQGASGMPLRNSRTRLSNSRTKESSIPTPKSNKSLTQLPNQVSHIVPSISNEAFSKIKKDSTKENPFLNQSQSSQNSSLMVVEAGPFKISNIMPQDLMEGNSYNTENSDYLVSGAFKKNKNPNNGEESKDSAYAMSRNQCVSEQRSIVTKPMIEPKQSQVLRGQQVTATSLVHKRMRDQDLTLNPQLGLFAVGQVSISSRSPSASPLNNTHGNVSASPFQIQLSPMNSKPFAPDESMVSMQSDIEPFQGAMSQHTALNVPFFQVQKNSKSNNHKQALLSKKPETESIQKYSRETPNKRLNEPDEASALKAKCDQLQQTCNEMRKQIALKNSDQQKQLRLNLQRQLEIALAKNNSYEQRIKQLNISTERNLIKRTPSVVASKPSAPDATDIMPESGLFQKVKPTMMTLDSYLLSQGTVNIGHFKNCYVGQSSLLYSGSWLTVNCSHRKMELYGEQLVEMNIEVVVKQLRQAKLSYEYPIGKTIYYYIGAQVWAKSLPMQSETSLHRQKVRVRNIRKFHSLVSLIVATSSGEEVKVPLPVLELSFMSVSRGTQLMQITPETIKTRIFKCPKGLAAAQVNERLFQGIGLVKQVMDATVVCGVLDGCQFEAELFTGGRCTLRCGSEAAGSEPWQKAVLRKLQFLLSE